MAVTLFSPTRTRAQTRLAGLPVRALHAWHLCSLDAPTVAVLWTAFFARQHHLALPTAELAAMFLAVWLLYVADRLLDARHNPAQARSNLLPRHLFHRHHRRAFLAAAAVGVGLLIPLTRHLPPADLHLDLALAAALACWFLLIHLAAPHGTLPKELAAGLFFAAATLIPVFTREPATALIPEALLFAALCTFNGLSISAWESDRAPLIPQPRPPIGRPALVLISTSTVLALLIRSPAALAIALAAAALFLLDRHRATLHPTTLRAAADLALLTPVLLWPMLR